MFDFDPLVNMFILESAGSDSLCLIERSELLVNCSEILFLEGVRALKTLVNH